jgi:uncharacterized protein YbjT (DUF2867 family)
MRIAIAGGTGTVGRYVVDAARAGGHSPVVLTRSAGVDLMTGTGLAAALVGADAVIDVSNVATTNKAKAITFFETVTRNLLAAEAAAGVRHHVALSIVGVDRVDFGYYLGKRRQEELVLDAAVPGSVLRATQFHEFAAQLLERGPVALVPPMLTQPIAAREVAQALVKLAAGAPVGMSAELAGPDQHRMLELVRRVARTRRRRRLVVPIPLPGAVGRGMRDGALLPTGDGPRGRQTFTQWLDSPAGRGEPADVTLRPV